MEKYYVSGCKGQDDDIVTCDDEDAQFWTIYQCDSMGLSQGLVDFTFREYAEAAMKVYAERDALQRKVEATEALMLAMRDDSRESRSKLELVVAENVALKESRKRLGEFILEEVDADYPLNMDVKTPATDAMVNEIRAEGVELYADMLGHLAMKMREIDQPRIRVASVNAESTRAHEFANQLRADSAKDGSDD